ncbi:hypothetical protein HCC45_04705 [Streptococcus suis]|nr:hypothetical protein [Streptococcus suis]
MMPQSALYQGFTAFQNQMILFYQEREHDRMEGHKHTSETRPTIIRQWSLPNVIKLTNLSRFVVG